MDLIKDKRELHILTIRHRREAYKTKEMAESIKKFSQANKKLAAKDKTIRKLKKDLANY
ncbi:hypothetical protein GOV10_06305 [Candidatus Woesearchaeota archaeon]|nr:hypothetical protein [Candidatus Woesearchaeota archaeon]